MRSLSKLLLSAAFPVLASPAFAQAPVSLTVSGNQATGVIDLPGDLHADLTIGFEHASGLTPSALGVTADVVNPLDLSILSRLPATGVGIPAGFPVIVRIDAASGSALTFTGVATVMLYTHNLSYVGGSHLVLYSAHAGGAFRDITRAAGSGSYRVSGSSGTFSEFLIVADTRPIDAILVEKYDALQATLDESAARVPAAVAADLQARLTESRAHYEAGSTAVAIADLDGFSSAVGGQSGTAIRDVWRADDASVINVAGQLRAGADTLRFGLDRKASGSP